MAALGVNTTINRPIFQTGDHGQEIVVLQQYLNVVGFSPGAIDGSFGPKTLAAVKKFQQSIGLAPDGVVWQDTFDALVNQYTLRGGTGPAPMPIVQVQGDYSTPPHDDPAASGPSPFPRWVLYVGLAAAGAVGLYFLTKQGPVFAGYGQDCDCDRGYDDHVARPRALKIKKVKKTPVKARHAAFPWRKRS